MALVSGTQAVNTDNCFIILVLTAFSRTQRIPSGNVFLAERCGARLAFSLTSKRVVFLLCFAFVCIRLFDCETKIVDYFQYCLTI